MVMFVAGCAELTGWSWSSVPSPGAGGHAHHGAARLVSSSLKLPELLPLSRYSLV